MEISEQLLIDNYFTKFSDPILKEVICNNKFDGTYYEKSIDNNYFITITYYPFNTVQNGNWHVHVDNCDRDTIGNMYVNTIEDFNKFLELLKINYKLK